MAYQPQTRRSKKIGRRHEMPKHEKTKTKAAGKKHRSSRSYLSEEKHVSTSEEVVDRILNSLRILGNQKFALSPFYEHFDRWLANLGDVLSEFESNSTISKDDQFVKERLQALSNIKVHLEVRRREEVSRDETIRNLASNRILLKQIEKEYTTRKEENEKGKNGEINRLSRNVDSLKGELDRISRMKTGIFRVISKKTMTQEKAEVTQRLNFAQRDLRLAVQYFPAEQEQLRDEYEKRKQLIVEQIRDLQKEVENQELDRSLEDRRAVCESLANAVNTLIQRKDRKMAEKEIEGNL